MFPLQNKYTTSSAALTVLLIAVMVQPVTLIAQTSSAVERKLVTPPKLSVPTVASTANVGGKVTVRVDLNNDGTVAKVVSVAGPDWVCSNYNSEPIDAICEAARLAAMQARFDAIDATAKGVSKDAFLTFTFPVKVEPKSATSEEFGARVSNGTTGNADVAKIVNPSQMVSGGVLNGKALKLGRPTYPATAKAVGASGSVTVQVLIVEDGRIYSAKPLSGHPLLQSAARSAACESKFTQTVLMGNPVKVSGVITYNFVL